MSDTWLNESLLYASKADTPEAMVEGKRRALLSDFRNFLSSCQIIDVKITEIGGRGWKPNKATAGYIAHRQQEIYRRLCARRESLRNDKRK